jgi:serine protease Do
LIAAVTANSPGAEAGLKQGDVVLSFNGADINQLRDLPRTVSATKPGSTATMTVWRNGQKTELQAKIGEAPENPRVAAAGDHNGPSSEDRAQAAGLHFGALTPDMRRELHLGRDVGGVVITSVDDGSAADSLGLTRGDVVLSINQQPVTSPQDAAQKIKEAASSPRKSALLLLNRRGVTQYVGLDLGKNEG